MNIAFRRMSIGLLLVLLDIKIIYFDILPDFIGYFMMLSALRTLGEKHAGYRKAEPFAMLLGLAALTELLPLWQTVSWNSASELPISSLIYGCITGICQLLLLERFMFELAKHAREAGHRVLADSADSRRLWYVIASAVYMLTIPFILNAGVEFVTAAIVAGLVQFLVLLAVYFLCRKAAKSAWHSPKGGGGGHVDVRVGESEAGVEPDGRTIDFRA
ncbi:hypothetical protein [Paenibacillus sp. NPDC058071]|uniref:hypothetical protein n=1 Tax=Paenibacillus sp. NPDC058071 TaxID=3346326 RepID=UPI0036DF6B43